MDWLWIYGPLVAAAVYGGAPEWAKMLLFVVAPAAFCASYVESVPTFFLWVGILFAMDSAHLNVRDAGRSGYCPCFTRRGDLNWRLRALSRSVDLLVFNPNHFTISACAHMFGSVLGWFAGKPYVRVTADVMFLAEVDKCGHECVHRVFSGLVPMHPECEAKLPPT